MRSRGLIFGASGALVLVTLSIVGALWTLFTVTLFDLPTIAIFIITIASVGIGIVFGAKVGLRPSTPYW